MTTVNEVNNDKTKVPDEFIFVVFRLFVLLLNSTDKLIEIDVHVCLLLNFGCVRVCTRTIASVFLYFSPLFCRP